MSKPEPPPWALLLTVARKAAHLTGPEAARAAGISRAQLNAIENGYEHRPLTGYSPVRGKDDTIAHLAAAVGVTPEQLEEAGRGDAAVVLREILRREQADQPAAPLDPAGDLVRELWGDPDRAPDFIRVMATAPSRVADDETKVRLIREYAEQYPPPGYRGQRDRERGSRSA